MDRETPVTLLQLQNVGAGAGTYLFIILLIHLVFCMDSGNPWKDAEAPRALLWAIYLFPPTLLVCMAILPFFILWSGTAMSLQERKLRLETEATPERSLLRASEGPDKTILLRAVK